MSFVHASMSFISVFSSNEVVKNLLQLWDIEIFYCFCRLLKKSILIFVYIICKKKSDLEWFVIWVISHMKFFVFNWLKNL